MVQETVDKITVVREKLKTSQDCQKGQVDLKKRSLEFQVSKKEKHFFSRTYQTFFQTYSWCFTLQGKYKKAKRGFTKLGVENHIYDSYYDHDQFNF